MGHHKKFFYFRNSIRYTKRLKRDVLTTDQIERMSTFGIHCTYGTRFYNWTVQRKQTRIDTERRTEKRERRTSFFVIFDSPHHILTSSMNSNFYT